MLKSVRSILKKEQEPYRIPRRVQDTIPVQRIWKDGVFQVGNGFSKTFRFTDINYLVASMEDKERMFRLYSELLNGLDSSATTKLTIYNHKVNREQFQKSILMPLREDGLDEYRKEYNQMLLDKATGGNGMVQEKLITVCVFKPDVDQARLYFNRVEADLTARFQSLGSRCVPLTAEERLYMLHDFYRAEEEGMFRFDLADMMAKGHDFRDYICPDSMEIQSDYLKLGKRYGRVFFLKHFAAHVKDDFITEFTDLNRNLMLSMDILSIPTDEAVQEVERRLLGVETNLSNWQRRQNSNNNFSALPPYDMEQQREASKELLDDFTVHNQRMNQMVLTLMVTADTKEQLDSDTESILALARQKMCQMAVLTYQQLDGLKTVLPLGARKINAFRTLNTRSLAVFMPFKVQEVQEHGGIYFGENAISHNLIMCNRANLLNQSAVLLGVPGSGKSFSAKELITFLILNTEDDILIGDPEGEYAHLVQAMGDMAAVVEVAAGGEDRLNAMEMVEGYGERDPIVAKSQFIMSLLTRIDPKCMDPHYKSIVDRCTDTVFQRAKETGEVPTLSTLREELLKQDEPMAKDMALSLELFTTGSLDMFGHQGNVNLDKRVVVFDINGLGEQLKPLGHLVITDTMLNRVILNWKKGKRTHVFIDELHVMFEDKFSAEFFNSAWRQFRKRNAYPTAITQNVEFLLDSPQGRSILSNSELVVMLNQAARDRDKLAQLLHISEDQQGYITDAPAGCGLIKYGSTMVPFVNRFPKDTKLYELMTTKPGEGRFGGQ